MAVALNHTIVASRDKVASAGFITSILGLAEPRPVSHFLAVELGNGVTLDYDDADVVHPQHYAFLVADDDFDAIFERVQSAGIAYWADPNHRVPNVVNDRAGGRGFYFSDPDGHNMEVFTTPPL